MNASGQPRTELSLADLSVMLSQKNKGLHGLVGVTERGTLHTPRLLTSWSDYVKHYGGLLSTSWFPLYCKMILDKGIKIKVSRVAHYGTITNITTLSGVKATVSDAVVGSAGNAETRATGSVTITAIGANGNVIDIVTSPDTINYLVIGSYTKVSGDTTTTMVATAVAAAINAKTSVTGYSATASANAVTVTPAAGQGGSANGDVLQAFFSTGSTMTATSTNFSGGINAVAPTYTSAAVYTADNIGVWGNNLVVTVGAASNGSSGYCNITVSITGSTLPAKTYKNMLRPDLSTTFMTQSLVDSFNAFFAEWVVLSGTLNTITFNNGTYNLAGGSNGTAANTTDYAGDASTGTGIHAYDADTEIVRIAVPDVASTTLDNAIETWVENTRPDLRALLRTPIGLVGSDVVAYRQRTGIYNQGTPVASWRCSMATGGVKQLDPLSGGIVNLSEIADWIVTKAKVDANYGEWWSFSGAKRGMVSGRIDVVYNFYPRRGESDLLDDNGINALVRHPSFNLVFWGNGSMYFDSTSLLKHDNVCELFSYLWRVLPQTTQIELFDPNDISTWKAVYRRVEVVMNDVVKRRGAWDWVYQGDQDIDTISQAVVNDQNNVNNGEYVFNLFVKPKTALKYLGIQVAVSNSGANFKILETQPF